MTRRLDLGHRTAPIDGVAVNLANGGQRRHGAACPAAHDPRRMTTTMHRLQISLPQWQHQFLLQRARRDGVSVAQVIRLLIEREVEARGAPVSEDSVWTISGIAEDRGPLITGWPVSEAPGLYGSGGLPFYVVRP